jgi:hypothetical protein
MRRVGELEGLGGPGEQVEGPGTDEAVGRGGDEVVGVLSADEGERVDRVGVTGGGEGGFEDGEVLRAGVPDQDLARVGAPDDVVGMKGREGAGEDIRLLQGQQDIRQVMNSLPVSGR